MQIGVPVALRVTQEEGWVIPDMHTETFVLPTVWDPAGRVVRVSLYLPPGTKFIQPSTANLLLQTYPEFQESHFQDFHPVLDG